MAKVVNGEVGIGDRVAYATRQGNSAGIHLGTVVALVPYESRWYDREARQYIEGTRYKLRVQIEAETDSRWKTDRIRTIEALDRVVKV